MHRPQQWGIAVFAACLVTIITFLASPTLATTNGAQTRVSTVNGSTPIPSATQAGPTTPVFVVWTHTDIPDNGQPTLDLLELENVFVQKLSTAGVHHVLPSSTTPIAPPAPANWYLLNIDIRSIRDEYRYARDENKTIYRVPFFHVELRLQLKYFRTGKVLGQCSYTADERLENDERDIIAAKRLVIADAVKGLVKVFLRQANAGQFGLDISTATEDSSWSNWALPFVPIISVVICIISVSLMVRDRRRDRAAAIAAAERARQQREQCFHNALALFLKTGNFSDDACQAAAAANINEILSNHAAIESKEAFRLSRTKAFEQWYEAVAADAIHVSDFTKEQVIDMLRKFDLWEFRVFEEAKKLAIGEANR